MQDVQQLVALVQRQRDLAALALVLKLGQQRPLDDAALGHHEQVLTLAEAVHGYHGGDALALRQLDQVDDVAPASRPRCLGNLEGAQSLHAPRVGEEQHGGVRMHGHDLLDEVLLPGGHGGHALAAAVLGGVGVAGQALDIARMRQRHDAGVLLDQILVNDLVCDLLDARPALIAVLVADGGDFLLDDVADLLPVAENHAVLADCLVQRRQSVLYLLALQTGQASQRQRDDRLRLLLGQSGVLIGGEGSQVQGRVAGQVGTVEPLHQVHLGCRGIRRRPDDGDDLIQVIQRQLIALEDMRLPECGGKVELNAPPYDAFLMHDIVIQDLRQIQHLRLVVDQRQHIDRAGILQLGVAVELIQDDVSVRLALVLHHDAHTALTGGLVPDLADPLDALILDQSRHGLDQQALIDAVGDFGDDDAALVLLDLCLSAHDDASLTRQVGFLDSVDAVDGAVCGEVGALDEVHQLRDGAVRVIHSVHGGVNDLAQVMGRDIGRHTDRDTHGAVDQQVREPGGQDGGFLEAVIEVGHHRHDVLVDIPEHFVRQSGHSRLGIPVCGRRVAVDGAEVALSVYQLIAHIERLCEVHHGAVHGAVAVRVVLTQHGADRGCGFSCGFIVCQVLLVHIVQHAALTRFESVPHVRQCALHDDRHGVFDKGFPHLMLQVYVHDFLVFKEQAFVFSFLLALLFSAEFLFHGLFFLVFFLWFLMVESRVFLWG